MSNSKIFEIKTLKLVFLYLLISVLNIKNIKQDSHIYVPYSQPNGWTDWAEIFCGHSGVAGG